MIPRIRLNELFPDWKTGGGIITAISEISGYTPPWAASVDETTLDIQYHGNHSGRKKISPLVGSLIDWSLVDWDTTPPDFSTAFGAADITILATVIKSMYSVNWSKLWATLEFSYNPINNYDMTEEISSTDNDTGTVTDVGSTVHGETVTTSDDVETSSEVTASQDGSVFGFNSETAVPSDSQEGSNTGSGTQNRDISEVHSGTDTQGNTRTNDLEHTKEQTLTRSGNIGVTTTQQMIAAERQTWIWQFFDVVFSDIDKIITSQVY